MPFKLPTHIKEQNNKALAIKRWLVPNDFKRLPITKIKAIGEHIGGSPGRPEFWDCFDGAYRLPNGMIFEIYAHHRGLRWEGVLYKSYSDWKTASEYQTSCSYYERF